MIFPFQHNTKWRILNHRYDNFTYVMKSWLIDMEYLFHRWSKYVPNVVTTIPSSFHEWNLQIITCYRFCTYISNQTSATCGVGYAHPSEVPGISPGIWLVYCCLVIVFYVVFCMKLNLFVFFFTWRWHFWIWMTLWYLSLLFNCFHII